MVIFNPLKGYWTHNFDDFSILVHAVLPIASHKTVVTIIESLGAEALNKDKIKPYHGNRYLLYRNGVYDTAQTNDPKTGLPSRIISLDTHLVHELHFTERSYHKINLVVGPPLPQYDALSDKNGQPNAMWTPLKALNGYSDFDKRIRTYFLFCLSLGEFSSHNFGVCLDMQGPTGFGKSTLRKIFEKIFGMNRVMTLPFDSLNERFAFTSYPDNTAVIWVDELNTTSKPLDSQGISTYDNLEDSQARFQVKNKGDYILSDPPMTFLEGTDFLKTSNPDVGPYRRTLVMKFPNNLSKKKKKLFYTTRLDELIQKPDVVAWLNWHMIMAYRKYIDVSTRCHDFMINLMDPQTLKIFPKKARSWRKHLREHNTDIAEWFTEVLQPCLNPQINDPNPKQDLSRVQKAFMYHLFWYYMRTNYHEDISNKINDNHFWNEFKAIADENGWEIKRIQAGNQPLNRSRLLIKQLTTTHINFAKYKKLTELPPDYIQSKNIRKQPFGFNNPWSRIIKVRKLPDHNNKNLNA